MGRMYLTNLYIDEDIKQQVTELVNKRISDDMKKGAFSATIRTLLKYFLSLPQNEQDRLIEASASEYMYQCKKNKRSSL